jgi:hypothetical protein
LTGEKSKKKKVKLQNKKIKKHQLKKKRGGEPPKLNLI